MNEGKEIRFVDLFAGIGGFHLGLTEANRIDTDENGDGETEAERKSITGEGYDALERDGSSSQRGARGMRSSNGGSEGRSHSGFRCVWANEWDKYAAKIYQARFPETPLSTDDIRKVNADDIPDHDLLCAGFPCQAFSVAGKRRGFEEAHGTLFFEIARIAERKRPRLLLLENVKGLLSHDGGRTFWVILRILGELGYFCEWQVLNSKWFGVPQNRERVFIVGYLGEEPSGTVFPITEISGDFEEGVSEASSEQTASSIIAGYGKQNMRGSYMLQVQPILTPDRPEKKQHGRRFKDQGEPMFTLTGQDIHGVAYPEVANTVCDGWLMDTQHHSAPMNQYRIRRLTPVECERLQGFPDGFTEGISDTQRYKCLGNAVTVNVVKFLGERIKEI